jgi:hypothetical protein
VVRPAVGVQQHRQGRLERPCGQQQGRAQLAPAGAQQQRPRAHRRRLGQRADDRHRATRPLDGRGGAVAVQGGAGQDRDLAGGHGAVEAGLAGEPLGRAAGDDPPQVHLGRLLGGGHQHRAAAGGDHLLDLEAGWGDRGAVDGQPAGVAARVVGGHHQAAVQPGRHPGDELDPDGVALRGQLGGRAGVGVGAEHPCLGLVAGLHQQGQRAARLPDHRGQVGERGPVPADLDAAAVQADHGQPHLGVGGAGGRVGQRRRLGRRVGRVGQVEPAHGAGVDPGHRQPLAVRRPPVAAVAAHLLGGDELGQPPGHLRVVLTDQRAPGGRCGRQRRDVHGAAGDPGDPPPGRVDPRVQHPAAGQLAGRGGGARGRREPPRGGRGRQEARLAVPWRRGRRGGQVGDEQPAGERERGDGQVPVGAEGDDAAGPLPGPLAPGQLGGGHVAGHPIHRGATLEPPGPPQQRGRVGHQPLAAARQVQHPQPVDRVVAGRRAQERDPGAVGADREPAWPSQREPAGAGVSAGEPAGLSQGPRAPRRCRPAPPRTR